MSFNLPAPSQPMTSASIVRCGDILGRAFLQDPLMIRIEPSIERRRRGLPAVFTACLRHVARCGEVIEAPESTGALGWFDLQHLSLGWRDVLASFLPVPLHFGIRPTVRLSAHDDYCDSRVLAHAPSNAAYIYVLGVAPEFSGQGIGSSLIQRALARIDGAFSNCLLRTEQPKNVRLYERYGFRCVEHCVVPASGVDSWIFLR